MVRVSFALLVLFAALPALSIAQTQALACPVNPIRSNMDVTLDEVGGLAEVLVYNISGNYIKTGLPSALVIRSDLSELGNIQLCYGVTDAAGKATFVYDPNYNGCLDYWFVFCPLGDAASSLQSRQQCLNGSALPSTLIQNAIPACAGGGGTAINHIEHLPSHNELYFCNQAPRDFSALCWPLMIIFGTLIGASFLLGRNPFQAFDLSAPRMGRGKVYTARVQQKSFDFLGYVMATDKAVETAGTIAGKLSGDKDVKNEHGQVIGKVDKNGNVIGTSGEDKGKVIGKIDGNGNAVLDRQGPAAGGTVAGGKVFGANHKVIGTVRDDGMVLNRNGDVIGRADGSLFLAGKAEGNVVSRDPGWKGPMGLVSGLVGMAVGKGVAALTGLNKRDDDPKNEGREITKDKVVIGKVDREGHILALDGVTELGFVDKYGFVVGNSSTGDALAGAKMQEKPAVVITNASHGGTGGQTGGSMQQGGGTSATAKTASQQAAETLDNASKTKLGMEKGSAPWASLFTAPNVLGPLSILFDKPWKLSADDAEQLDKIKFLKIEKNAVALAEFAFEKMKQNGLSLTLDKDRLFDSLFSMYSLMTSLSVYMKGAGAFAKSEKLAGSLGFMEDFNNKSVFTLGDMPVSFGTFASYMDPTFQGGAGVPYALNFLQPLFAGARNAAEFGLDQAGFLGLNEARPDGEYIHGMQGYGIALVLNSDLTLTALDSGNGNVLSQNEVEVRMGIRIENLKKEGKTEEAGRAKLFLTALKEGAGGRQLNDVLSDAGFGAFYGKKGADGMFYSNVSDSKGLRMSKEDFDSGLAKQQHAIELRASVLSGVLGYMDSPDLSAEELKNSKKYSELLEEGKLTDDAQSLLDKMKSLDKMEDGEKQKGMSTDIEKQLKALKDRGIIDHDTLGAAGTQTRRQALLEVVNLADIDEKMHDADLYSMVKVQINNASMQAATLQYVRDFLGKIDDSEKQRKFDNAIQSGSISLDDVSKAIGAMDVKQFKKWHEQGYVEKASLQDIKEELSEMLDSHQTKKSLLATIGAELAKFQTYQNTETEARRALQLMQDVAKDGSIGKALEYMELKNDLKAAKDNKDAEEVKELEGKVKNFYQSSFDTTELDNTLKELRKDGRTNTLEYAEAVAKSGSMERGKLFLSQIEEGEKYQGDKTIKAIYDENRTLVKNISARIDLLDSASQLLYADSNLSSNGMHIDTGLVFAQLASVETKLKTIDLKNVDEDQHMQQIGGILSDASSIMQRVNGDTMALMGDVKKNHLTNGIAGMLVAGNDYLDLEHKPVPESKVADSYMEFEIKRSMALQQIIQAHDYEGAGAGRPTDEQLENHLAHKISQAITSRVDMANSWASAESFGSFVDAMVKKEATLYQTSEQYLEQKVHENLGTARHGADFLGSAEQQFLEGQDIFGEKNRMRPRLPGPLESYSEYLYGDRDFGGLPNWNPEKKEKPPGSLRLPNVEAKDIEPPAMYQPPPPQQREDFFGNFKKVPYGAVSTKSYIRGAESLTAEKQVDYGGRAVDWMAEQGVITPKQAEAFKSSLVEENGRVLFPTAEETGFNEDQMKVLKTYVAVTAVRAPKLAEKAFDKVAESAGLESAKPEERAALLLNKVYDHENERSELVDVMKSDTKQGLSRGNVRYWNNALEKITSGEPLAAPPEEATPKAKKGRKK